MAHQVSRHRAARGWWPSPQDYNEAIQNPHCNLQDDELQKGLVYLDSMGLPRPVTGSFASVYRIQCDERDLAIRCFLRDIVDQEERYAHISEFVANDGLEYTVTFDFLHDGIRAAGRWFPALKMEWVEGDTLDHFICQNLANPYALWELENKFVEMMAALRLVGMAHGDLQHGNIIVCQDEQLRLVDYDGMYVPTMTGLQSNELGHRNYQHPRRAARHFGPQLDNFSSWVIYASIRAIHLDPTLLQQLAGGDDCLLFRQSDFLRPMQSPSFAAFERHEDHELQNLGRFIRAHLASDPDLVPPLTLPVPEVEGLEAIPESISVVRERFQRPLPEWLNDANADALAQGGEPPDSLVNLNPARGATSLSVTVTSGGPAPARVPPAHIAKLGGWVPPTAQQSQQPQQPMRLLPPELVGSALPRTVQFDPNCVEPPPARWQFAMIFNPLLWAFIWCLFSVNSFGSFVFGAAVLACELAIWVPALKDKGMVELGEAALAEVTFKYVETMTLGFIFSTNVSVKFRTQGSWTEIHTSVELPSHQARKVNVGDVVAVLYDPNDPQRAMIYDFCRYKVVS